MSNTKPGRLGRIGLPCVLFAGAFAGADVAVAQDFPTKAIRLIVPFAPGGSQDIIARLLAARLPERLGHAVVVDNRGGAGGTIGVELASQAKPDGYTLLIIAGSYVINNVVHTKLRYDPNRSFAPVAKLGEGDSVISIYPGLPVNSIRELIALAKREPGKLNYSTAGLGGYGHLGVALFVTMAGIEVEAVHFKGAGPAMIDTMAGNTHITFGSVFQQLPHIQTGKLKALGIGGMKRSSILPGVPTVDEEGLKGYETPVWWGILAPAGTPRAIVARLSAEIAIVLDYPEIKKIFVSQGAVVDHAGPAEFGKFLAVEQAKWAEVVKKARVRVE